jgi:hypothetical protein
MALTPFAAFAQANDGHQQAELANGFAQFDQAQQQVGEIQDEANRSAQNERMIAVLKSEAMRQRQLNMVANANAIEEIAAGLATSERTQGDVNARNSLAIAQGQAAILLANVDANLANARMLAQNKGRYDEWLNAQAQSDILHRVANYISGQLAEQNMANDKAIGEMRADIAHTPALAEVANSNAMGANELLGADLELRAGALAALSTNIRANGKATNVLSHASASLKNAQAQAQ